MQIADIETYLIQQTNEMNQLSPEEQLARTKHFLEVLDNPQHKLKTIHIYDNKIVLNANSGNIIEYDILNKYSQSIIDLSQLGVCTNCPQTKNIKFETFRSGYGNIIKYENRVDNQ